MIWCPYTGVDIDNTAANVEHIIPGILGGTATLTIRVDASKNHALGSRLDQLMAQMPFISLAIRHYDLHGHRRRERIVRWPAEVRGLSGRINFARDGFRFETHRSQNKYGINLARSLEPGEALKLTPSFDFNLLLSFCCKVALGAGTFLYGDTFRSFGFHNELRTLMDTDESNATLRSMRATNPDLRFWVVSPPQSVRRVMEPWGIAISRQPDRHIIWSLHTASEVVLCVSLFGGLFQWLFNIASDAQKFPIGGDFELGATIEIDLNSGTMQRSNLRDYLVTYCQNLRQPTRDDRMRGE